MSTLLALKDILLSNDIFSEKEGKRHASHEFQAYAYRLASDLNDLNNLQIYMRLAKTVERSVLERVYSFVSDINTDEKGRLFLWKLKQVRMEIKKQRDMHNFDYEFTLKKMKRIRNLLHQSIIAKNDEMINGKLSIALDKYFLTHEVLNKKVLLIGNDSTLLPKLLISKGMKVFGIDISNLLTNYLKEDLKGLRNIKLISKDFLRNIYPNECFDLIIINKFWGFIPLDAEIKFINEINRILCNDGKVILSTRTFSNQLQEWKPIFIKGNEEMYFEKINTSENLKNNFDKFNFKSSFEYLVDELNYFMFSH